MLSSAMTNQADLPDVKTSFATHHAAMITKSDNQPVWRQNIWDNIEDLLETTILMPVVQLHTFAVTVRSINQNNFEQLALFTEHFSALQSIHLEKCARHSWINVVGDFYAAFQSGRTCKKVKHMLALAMLLNPRPSFRRLERVTVKRLPKISKNNAQEIALLKLRASAENEKRLKDIGKKSLVLTPL